MNSRLKVILRAGAGLVLLLPLLFVLGLKFAPKIVARGAVAILGAAKPVPKVAGYGYEVGNADVTSKQLEKMFVATNGDASKIVNHRELWDLEDRKYGEDPSMQIKNICPIVPLKGQPFEGQVFCYTDIYYYKNQKVEKGDRVTYAPTGFFLVTDAKGVVHRVPPDRVRVLDRKPIFPMMKEWRADLPKLMEFESVRS